MGMKICNIDGCEKPMQARGWCVAHWQRWKRHGDPLGGRHTPPIQADDVFGRLTVIERAEDTDTMPGVPRWLCKCECGNTTIVWAQALRKGATRSCGCLRDEIASSFHTQHGYARDEVNYINGNKRHYLYNMWLNMRQRCNNPNHPGYADYGGRGITVDPRWDDFRVFLSDMGERPSKAHSIDRRDNNGHYEPGNCRWATTQEQAANKRPRGTGARGQRAKV